MGAVTGIAWTHHTFNPWWGCERVSDGCLHCYAEVSSKRWGFSLWGRRASRRVFGDKHWRQPEIWNLAAEAAGVPALVFCASMSDVFEDRRELIPERARLFALIERTPWLRWQLLTKRPQNVRVMVPPHWLAGEWPSNCWLGTTVEHQLAADERVPLLLNIPAPVRFLSCEPLLGPIELRSEWLVPNANLCSRGPKGPTPADLAIVRAIGEQLGGRFVDWVIVGGESGPGHRPLDLASAGALVARCEAAGVPVFFKQVGGIKPTSGGDLLDGRRIKQFPTEAGQVTPVTVGAWSPPEV